jgi:hypothetical protein
MSELVERAARGIAEGFLSRIETIDPEMRKTLVETWWPNWVTEAEFALREVLAEMREAVAHHVPGLPVGEPNPYGACCDIDEARNFLDAFARENGLADE